MSEIPFKKIESDRGGTCHCSRRPEIPFYFKDIYFKETNLMTSLLFYPGMGPAVLTLAELKSFIIKYEYVCMLSYKY
jgi:hypothetical protein